jgi:hypothetical protein
MKLVTYISAPEGQSRDAFQAWFKDKYLPGLIKGAPSLCNGVFRRRIDAPPAFNFDAHITEIAQCDVLLELWFPSTEDFRREVLPIEQQLKKAGCKVISYAIYPRLVKDARATEAGPNGRRPKVTLVGSIKWLAGVPTQVARDHYEVHASIALRTQPVLTKYEQNIVMEVVSKSPGTSAIDAYSDFSFASIEDMTKRFVTTEEELTDIADFLGSALVTFFGDAEPVGPA